MRWEMILLLVILGFGLTGSAQADEINYWQANMQVGSTQFPPFTIPCPTDQNLPPLAEQCQREFVVFDIKHDPADQIGALIVTSYSFDTYYNPATGLRAWWNTGGPYSVSLTIAPHPFMSRTTATMRLDHDQSTPGVAGSISGGDYLKLISAWGQSDPGIMPQNGGE